MADAAARTDRRTKYMADRRAARDERIANTGDLQVGTTQALLQEAYGYYKYTRPIVVPAEHASLKGKVNMRRPTRAVWCPPVKESQMALRLLRQSRELSLTAYSVAKYTLRRTKNSGKTIKPYVKAGDKQPSLEDRRMFIKRAELMRDLITANAEYMARRKGGVQTTGPAVGLFSGDDRPGPRGPMLLPTAPQPLFYRRGGNEVRQVGQPTHQDSSLPPLNFAGTADGEPDRKRFVPRDRALGQISVEDSGIDPSDVASMFAH